MGKNNSSGLWDGFKTKRSDKRHTDSHKEMHDKW